MAHVLQGDRTVLPATCTQTIPAFTHQPQSIKGMARLSRLGC